MEMISFNGDYVDVLTGVGASGEARMTSDRGIQNQLTGVQSMMMSIRGEHFDLNNELIGIETIS